MNASPEGEPVARPREWLTCWGTSGEVKKADQGLIDQVIQAQWVSQWSYLKVVSG